MASFTRAELDEWVQSWLQANKDCEKAGDWKPLADFYAPEATYGWNIGPKEDVMCVGIDEIRDIALGLEMEGLENWQYPYQKVLIDDKPMPLNADKLIEWQRDFFDFGHVSALYMQLIKEGKLSAGMQKRIERSMAGEKLPGYYPLGQAPVPIW